MSVRDFYDGLAPLYHLVYGDWEESVRRQGEALASLIEDSWGRGARDVLDASCGIGTQSLGLLEQGFRVVASDLVRGALGRARGEARRRGLSLPAFAADFRALPVRPEAFDVVLLADNPLAHAHDAAEVRGILAECGRCVRPGGGLLLSMRDYPAPPPPGTVEVHPYGERLRDGRPYDVRQVWRWRGARYDLFFEFRPVDGGDAIVLKTTCLALPVSEVMGLMRAAGFAKVARLDGRFFQPVIVGTRPGRKAG